MEVRRALVEGRVALPRVGEVRRGDRDSLPYLVVDGDGREIESFGVFLRDLALTDAIR